MADGKLILHTHKRFAQAFRKSKIITKFRIARKEGEAEDSGLSGKKMRMLRMLLFVWASIIVAAAMLFFINRHAH
jgi:hypothetical protein